MGPFIDTKKAFELLKTEKNILFIDTRYDFEKDHNFNLEIYNNGHIEGAIYVDMLDDLCSPQAQTTGRHPLPTVHKFKEMLEKNSITKELHIICYDDASGGYAARLWFMLVTLEYNEVRILEGGFSAWIAESYPVNSDIVIRPNISFQLELPSDWLKGKMRIVEFEEVKKLVDRGFTGLIDARNPERFRGEESHPDPICGRIPGASNRWWKANIDEKGLIRDRKEIKNEFDLFFINNQPKDAVLYCGSGITACFNLAILMELDFAELPSIYIGSYSDWIVHSDKIEKS
jgi:thiosulfate/3-mercaptopyruvate sulfurtransferase